ncbi:epoxide hydrolase N-terminal domain-containing protein [Methanoculleus horonobensis]|jgi:hypothetical protein|uniref:epoxide hydrolase N-terminal domain-containing protein n=1 Tax=Methanoculleus horonobensis TaxID=528314 RepID=UPI0008325C98|nr:epoxide hydrolase N-terminal domain-containing protein [Methanoculleus horonobensis]MDD3070089.1 epoxide hydrolase N-terminal domain-containing protein [Methanoculleus horonobensis]MDD4252166.1 epoxide hydrolase N-terminal domain-containing protein [Methanoculleus horonobensis]
MPIDAFRIDTPGQVLDDLRVRLRETRLPDEVEGSGWDYGTNLGYMEELVDYWLNRFDWRARAPPEGYRPDSAAGVCGAQPEGYPALDGA